MSNADLITRDSTKALWAHLCKKYKVKVVRKDKSFLMRSVGTVMQVLGIMSKKTFMKDFCTTHGKKIYMPKRIKIGDTTTMLLWYQCCLACHEFTHVRQKVKYRYLYNRAARAKYESDAMLADMEFTHWVKGYTNPTFYTAKMQAYSLRKNDLKAAEKKFETYAKEVRKGRYRNPVVKEAIKFLTRYNQNTR